MKVKVLLKRDPKLDDVKQVFITAPAMRPMFKGRFYSSEARSSAIGIALREASEHVERTPGNILSKREFIVTVEIVED